MRAFWPFAYLAESDDSSHAHASRFSITSLKNSLNAHTLLSLVMWKLLAIFTLIYCLSVVTAFYLFNFSLASSELEMLIPLLLLAMTTLMIFACAVALFSGFVKQQKQLPTLINALHSQPADLTDEQTLARATSSMRQQISLDLHDSTIQPYIGLKLGLEALRRKIRSDDAMAMEVDELVAMTIESIGHLRLYITDLKPHLDQPLLEAIDAEVEKYQHHYGIEIAVKAESNLTIQEPLAAEIYQIVCEGLSNIRRHTVAKQAAIHLYFKADKLVVEIINHTQSKLSSTAFKPRSITERVTRLGGSVSINTVSIDSETEANVVVTAQIPMHATGYQYASH